MKNLSRVCILTIAALVAAWNAHAQTVDMAPYFNLVAGRQLLIVEFVDEGSGFVLDDTHMQSITSLGGGLKGELSYFSPLWSLEDVGLWQEQADGHYLVGYIEVDTGEREFHVPPVGPVDGLMEIGVPVVMESWIVIDDALDRLERLELTLLATGLQYQTRAGDFDDCAALKVDIFVSDTLVQQHYFIWARDVGEILAFEYVNTGGPLVLKSIHMTEDILALP